MDGHSTDPTVNQYMIDTGKLHNTELCPLVTEKLLDNTKHTEECNNPTEVDMSEEAIVNTQESIVSEDGKLEQEGQLKIQESVLIEEQASLITKKQPEIKRSDRLKNDIAITTKEKNERIARKRNLEGTTSNSVMFSDLPVETIKNLSIDMGIAVDQISFGTLDMLKDLEIARNNLHARQHEPVVVEQVDVSTIEDDINERLIEWLQDEHSETESDILAHSKKKKCPKDQNFSKK